jgi:hypothetical protein
MEVTGEVTTKLPELNIDQLIEENFDLLEAKNWTDMKNISAERPIVSQFKLQEANEKSRIMEILEHVYLIAKKNCWFG